METLQVNNITDTIINTINKIFSTLFSSIDDNLYLILDKLTFINTDILSDIHIRNLLNSNNIILIANSLLVGFVIYYCIKLLFSHLFYIEIEKPYQFIFKIIIFTICINFSYYICEKLIYFNDLISGSILQVGKNIFDTNINFSSLIEKINSVIEIEEHNFNIFSIDGLLKGFITVELFNLVLSYSLRYILVKIFVIMSPFAFLTLINSSSSWFFKSWFRNFISLLLLQAFVSIILLIVFSLDINSGDIFSKLLYISGIYILSKANIYIKELIGGISLNFSSYVNRFKSISK